MNIRTYILLIVIAFSLGGCGSQQVSITVHSGELGAKDVRIKHLKISQTRATQVSNDDRDREDSTVNTNLAGVQVDNKKDTSSYE